jgi:hypothetical protein
MPKVPSIAELYKQGFTLPNLSEDDRLQLERDVAKASTDFFIYQEQDIEEFDFVDGSRLLVREYMGRHYYLVMDQHLP